MKKLNIKVLSILAAMTGLFASCSQDELVKSEIDAQNYPAATIELSDITLGNVGTTTAELSFDVKGYTTEILEIAVVYSETPDFASTEVFEFKDSVAGETVNALLKGLNMETTYYATAYAYMRGGSAVADTISFTTKAEPISKEMLNGKAYGKAAVGDAFGKAAYDFNFTLATTESDTVWVYNLDPYFGGYGYVAEVGCNILGGILSIAEDGKTATITCWDDQLIGYDDAAVFGGSSDGADSVPLVLYLVKNGAKLQIPTYFGVRDSGGWWSAFPPTEFDAL